MANTIKIVGAGPLHGRTFYGTCGGPVAGYVRLILDEPGPDGFCHQFFSRESGFLCSPERDVETDLLRIDPDDMHHVTYPEDGVSRW
jgi:hypothetical protein